MGEKGSTGEAKTMTAMIRLGADYEAIRQVNLLAFGQNAEARLVDALRDAGYVRASLVVEKDQQVVGHILFSQLASISGAAVGETATAADLPQTINDAALRTQAAPNLHRMADNAVLGTKGFLPIGGSCHRATAWQRGFGPI
jgi:hypothetical protein